MQPQVENNPSRMGKLKGRLSPRNLHVKKNR